MGKFDYADDRREAAREEAVKAARAVKITQQFRERHNLTYEMDCAGIPLVLRVFFADVDGPGAVWRVEARAGRAPEPSVASASAPSRAQALQSIAASWRETATPALSNIDWDGVTRAMSSVRAI